MFQFLGPLMRTLNRLSALGVKKLPGGKHADGGGLWLIKRDDGGGNWIYRFAIRGKRREMGLGSIQMVSLRDAREQATHWRQFVANGKDPIRARERERREAADSTNTLSILALSAFEARKAELKGDGKAGRWFSPLELHVLPKLGDVPIEELTQRDIRDTLAPIWHEKAETAEKAINRLNIVIRHAAALDLAVDLQAVAKAKALLGAQRRKKKHIPAMPWIEVPQFYKSLTTGGIVDCCLAFAILTAGRSGEVRRATFDEIDFENRVWTISASRMKSGREHRVPLSAPAIRLIRTVEPLSREGLVFPSPRQGTVSDMAMAALMRRRNLEYRPHGFRSSFRDWCADETDTPREVAEACLAHQTGSEVERAYRRTDFFDRRRVLMERWGEYVSAK